MIAWLQHAPAVAVAVGVVFLPGVLIGVAARLRGLLLVAFAPILSTSAFGVGSIVLAWLGIGWSPGAALTVSLIAAAVAAGLAWTTRLARIAPFVPQDGRHLLTAGIAVGIAFAVARLTLYIQDPTSVSQTNDASFHLSALRFAVDTGWASPFQITTVIGAQTFYPSAWHLFAALVPPLTGDTVEVAANAVSVVIGGVVWPLGVAVLTRTIAGPVAATVATAAAAMIPAFPLLMVQWGVLYPQLLAIALLPAALAPVLAFRAFVRGDPQTGRPWPAVVRAVLLVGAAAGALVMAQPSVLLAWMLLVWFIVVTMWRPSAAIHRIIAAGVFTATAALLVALWWYFGQSIDGVWPAATGKFTAVLEVAMNGYLGYPWAPGISILAAVGVIVGIRTRSYRWVVCGFIAFAVLYVVAASVSAPGLRGFLTGPWYEDPYRLAALMPVAVVPLAGIGAAAVVTWAVRAGCARPARAGAVALAVIAGVGAVSLAVAPQIERRDVFANVVDPNLYMPTATSLLSVDERALLERLDQNVPADAVIVGNPSTGMSFGYALSGRNVIPRTWAPPSGEAYDVLWASLRDVADDPAVCPALDAFGARYVLDFGPGEQYPGRWIMPGFTGLADRPGFALVDRQGDATLWRVTACD